MTYLPEPLQKILRLTSKEWRYSPPYSRESEYAPITHDFSNQIWEDTDLAGLTFSNCNFKSATLRRCDLTQTRFLDCNLNQAILTDCKMVRSIISTDSRMVCLKLVRCNLTDSTLIGGSMRGSSISECDLTGTVLSQLDFRHAFFRSYITDSTILQSVVGNGSTIRTLQLGGYTVTYTQDYMQIGCHMFPISYWMSLGVEDARRLGGKKGVLWFETHRDTLEMILIFAPANPIPTFHSPEDN